MARSKRSILFLIRISTALICMSRKSKSGIPCTSVLLLTPTAVAIQHILRKLIGVGTMPERNLSRRRRFLFATRPFQYQNSKSQIADTSTRCMSPCMSAMSITVSASHMMGLFLQGFLTARSLTAPPFIAT